MIILKLFVEAQHYYQFNNKTKVQVSRYDGKHTDRKNILIYYANNGSVSGRESMILYSEIYKSLHLQDIL